MKSSAGVGQSFFSEMFSDNHFTPNKIRFLKHDGKVNVNWVLFISSVECTGCKLFLLLIFGKEEKVHARKDWEGSEKDGI